MTTPAASPEPGEGGRASVQVDRSALVPPPPPVARVVFGEALERVRVYAALLAGPGVERGLLGPREVDRLWDRHLLNCAVVAGAIQQHAAVVDLGSGAGLPGLVLAIVRPDLTITLLEPLLRRAQFLSECVERLGLSSVIVRRARAEDVVGEIVADVVTARAVAPMERLVGWALPLLRPGGELLALKGERAGEDLERARHALGRLGARDARIFRVGEGRVEQPTTVIRVVAGSSRRTRRRGRKR